MRSKFFKGALIPLQRDVVEQGQKESAAVDARIKRSASDLPILRIPSQDQGVTFSNAGLFELLVL